MATSGELAETLAHTLGIKLGTVNFYGQQLRDGGLLSTGGRGPSAARMSLDDAVNWLLALCCAETARSAAAVVALTKATPILRRKDRRGSPDTRLHLLKANTVEELIRAILDDERSGRLNATLITVWFRVGGGEVKVIASGVTDNSEIDWETVIEFINTKMVVRRRDLDETPITSNRTTYNRVNSGAFSDINSVLVEPSTEGAR